MAPSTICIAVLGMVAGAVATSPNGTHHFTNGIHHTDERAYPLHREGAFFLSPALHIKPGRRATGAQWALGKRAGLAVAAAAAWVCYTPVCGRDECWCGRSMGDSGAPLCVAVPRRQISMDF